MARWLTRGEVLVSFLRASFSQKSYFPPVWFAEADDSHLTDDERAKELAQGVARNWVPFEPLKHVDVSLVGYGARAFSGDLSTEQGTTAEVFTFTGGAVSGTTSLRVSTGVSVQPSGASAISGSFSPFIQSSASFHVSGRPARSGSYRPRINSEAHVPLRQNFAVSGGNTLLTCQTVLNPTDEEVVMWYMMKRKYILTSKYV